MIKILAKNVKIGDIITINPTPKGSPQENPYFNFDDLTIVITGVNSLPNKAFYFEYTGREGNRDSVYIQKDHSLAISLKSILKNL